MKHRPIFDVSGIPTSKKDGAAITNQEPDYEEIRSLLSQHRKCKSDIKECR